MQYPGKTRRAKVVQIRRRVKKSQKRTRADVRRIYRHIKARRRVLRTYQRQQLRFRSETFASTTRQPRQRVVIRHSASIRPAVFAELQYKTRRIAVGRLRGVTLKSRRRRRKSFFRLKTKRNINIRRRR